MLFKILVSFTSSPFNSVVSRAKFHFCGCGLQGVASNWFFTLVEGIFLQKLDLPIVLCFLKIPIIISPRSSWPCSRPLTPRQQADIIQTRDVEENNNEIEPSERDLQVSFHCLVLMKFRGFDV